MSSFFTDFAKIRGCGVCRLSGSTASILRALLVARLINPVASNGKIKCRQSSHIFLHGRDGHIRNSIELLIHRTSVDMSPFRKMIFLHDADVARKPAERRVQGQKGDEAEKNRGKEHGSMP